MPPSAMIAPASTKNGIASSAKSSVPSEILSITASSGMSTQSAAMIAAKPERVGDRHAERAQDGERAEQDEDVHGLLELPTAWSRYMIERLRRRSPTHTPLEDEQQRQQRRRSGSACRRRPTDSAGELGDRLVPR